MAKIGTSQKREKSSANTSKPFDVKSFKRVHLARNAPLERHDPKVSLGDSKQVSLAISECLLEGDYVGLVEILKAHLALVDKIKLSRDSHIGQRTIYRMLEANANPTLKTVTKMFGALKEL